MSHLDNARCLFIDGPVAVYLQQATEVELLEAYARLGRMVAVAAKGMNTEPSTIPVINGGVVGWEPAE